jgi:hypothetical protein
MDFMGESHAWEPNNSDAWSAVGNTNVLTATGLSSLSDDNDKKTDMPYGTDNIGLGEASPRSMILAHQTVAGMTSETFFVSFFGLSNVAFNLGEGKTTTFLANFQIAAHQIPSLSLSYTAGSYARNWTPSLVLGGYDSTRFDPTTSLEVDLRDTTALSDPYQLMINFTAITIKSDLIQSDDGSPDETRSLPVDIGSGLVVAIDPVTPQL